MNDRDWDKKQIIIALTAERECTKVVRKNDTL